MRMLKLGSNGSDVSPLQDRLRELGFNPGATDGDFGPATHAVVIAFQRSEGLLADGGRTVAALGLPNPPAIPSVIPGATVEIVSQMFPNTPVQDIRQNLPRVLEALVEPQPHRKKEDGADGAGEHSGGDRKLSADQRIPIEVHYWVATIVATHALSFRALGRRANVRRR